MPILHKTSSNYDFTVKTVPVYAENPITGEMERTGTYCNQKQDDGSIVGPMVSKRYKIADNAEVVDRAREALFGAGLNPDTAEFTARGCENDARWHFQWDWKDETIKLPAVGDELGLRLSVQNSFDRKLKVAFRLGMLRLACLNGMTTLEDEFALSKKHNGSLNLGFMSEALGKALDAFAPEKAGAVFSRLAELKVTQAQGLTILQNFVEDVSGFSERTRSRVSEIWNAPTHAEDSDRNLYNLYNATTQFLTHDVNPERVEMAEKLNRNVLLTLDSGVRNGEKELNRLWTPREPVAVVSEVQENVLELN